MLSTKQSPNTVIIHQKKADKQESQHAGALALIFVRQRIRDA